MANIQSFVDYPDPGTGRVRPGPFEYSAVAVALLCLLFAAMSRQAHLGTQGPPFLLACAVAGVLGIGVAVLNSWIPWMARHTYNVHYIVLVLTLAAPWTWSLADMFSQPGGTANLVWKGMLVGGGMWTLACVVAAPSRSPLTGLRGGLVGAALGGLPFATHCLPGWLACAALLVTAAGPFWPRGPRPESPQLDQQSQGAVAVLGFLMVNVAVVLTLAQVVGYFGYGLYRVSVSGYEELTMPSPTRLEAMPWDDICRRVLGGYGGAIAGFLGTFLWSQRRGPVIAMPLALCAAAVFLVDGRDPAGALLVATAIMVAAGLARPLPRMERFPHAWPAAAFGFLAASSSIAVDASVEGAPRIIPILLEGGSMLALLMIAYFAGLRNLTFVPKKREVIQEIA